LFLFPSWGWKRRPRATTVGRRQSDTGQAVQPSGFSRRSGIQSAEGISGTLTRQAAGQAAAPAYIPTIRRPPTGIKKRRFTIRALFEAGLQALLQDQGLDHDFIAKNETDFRAETFLEGRGQCVCRIWLGGMHSENNICYSEGRAMSDNSCNEIISLTDRRDELALTGEMAMGYTLERTLDLKRLTPDEVANYLWQRFVEPLER
jgi:hypothetical protein